MRSNDLPYELSHKGDRALRPALQPAARPTELSRLLMAQYARPGSVAVDATVGNGRDTLTLAELVTCGCGAGDGSAGQGGRVYGFDVQEKALAIAGERLRQEGYSAETAVLICDGHQHLKAYVKEAVSAVVFNLGYLPGGDKEIVTRAETTGKAVTAALELLEPGGAVIVTMYSGHEAGREEREVLLELARGLPKGDYHALLSSLLNQGDGAPEVLAIQKRGRRK